MNSVAMLNLPSFESYGGLSEEFACPDGVTQIACNQTDFFGFDRDKQWEIIQIILQGMNMEKYSQKFKLFNISLDTFLNLTDSDLVAIGITDKAERELILQSIGSHWTHSKDYVIKENHHEDLIIANNVLQQLVLLKNYAAFLDCKWTSQKITDYDGDLPIPPSKCLQIILEHSIVQCDKICSIAFGENDSDHLIGTVLKVHNMPQPKYLSKALNERKKKQTKFKKRIVGLIVIGLLITATIKYCRASSKC